MDTLVEYKRSLHDLCISSKTLNPKHQHDHKNNGNNKGKQKRGNNNEPLDWPTAIFKCSFSWSLVDNLFYGFKSFYEIIHIAF